jgi:hypothetical protein
LFVKKLTTSVLLLLGTILAALGSLVGVSVYRTHREADARLSDLRELAVSADPTAAFESIRQKYGSELHPLGCDRQTCQHELSLSNRNISAFRVVPYTELDIWFTAYEGSLVRVMVEYRTALNSSQSPVLHVQQDMCAHGCGVRFDVNPHGITQQMWNGLVEFNSVATPQQRNAALALNLDCLARIGGCDDITDLLPTMWVRAGPETIASRFVGLSQRLEESHGFPSKDDY